MARRMISLLLMLLLFSPALAEEYFPYQVTTFAGSLPKPLKEPLSALVADESQVLSGAAIFYDGYNSDRPEPEYQTCYSAMLLTSAADGTHLYAAAQPEGHPWQVNDYTRFLRQSEDVYISIYQPKTSHVPVFSVDYALKSGTVNDLFCFWNHQLWCLEGHINKEKAITIHNEMGMIDVTDAASHEKFRCSTPFFLDYMGDMSAFPTTRAEALANSWLPDYAPFSAGMTLYCEGANLRLEPTTKSESLGQYARNTPMIFTGKQKQGSNWPWYQVRIGDTLGWMSGNYVDDEPHLGYEPIPLGRTVTSCPLYARPGDSQPLRQLPPGTTFHLLAEYQGLYHICIPQGDISWAADVTGAYGYIPKENILLGASPSALDAQ